MIAAHDYTEITSVTFNMQCECCHRCRRLIYIIVLILTVPVCLAINGTAKTKDRIVSRTTLVNTTDFKTIDVGTFIVSHAQN